MDTERQPTLTTERLILRPFLPSDAPSVQRLAGDRAFGDTTERIPYPYEDGMAGAWIATYRQQFRERKECTFAIVLKDGQQVIGVVGLTLTMTHARGELDYWIGREFWNHGYCTEAARAAVEYGFLGFGTSPRSGQVSEPQSGFWPRHGQTRHAAQGTSPPAHPKVGRF